MKKIFLRYFSVGVVNTLIHWAAFGVLISTTDLTQAVANVVAFFCAVTFSFFANSYFTFNKNPSTGGYLLFVVFMGFIAFATGKASDRLNFPEWVTLVAFSITSLVLGFFYSKYIVFRREGA